MHASFATFCSQYVFCKGQPAGGAIVGQCEKGWNGVQNVTRQGKQAVFKILCTLLRTRQCCKVSMSILANKDGTWKR